jgi:hypothetical protein
MKKEEKENEKLDLLDLSDDGGASAKAAGATPVVAQPPPEIEYIDID